MFLETFFLNLNFLYFLFDVNTNCHKFTLLFLQDWRFLGQLPVVTCDDFLSFLDLPETLIIPCLNLDYVAPPFLKQSNVSFKSSEEEDWCER